MVDFSAIEQKWQKKWDQENVFAAPESGKKEPFYCLEMYPYPSGSGLHMGHGFNFTIADILARFKRMQGYAVLYPAGYDSFGLPAENAAIKAGKHPREFTETAIANFIRQQKALGLSYDWSRKLMSHDPAYYQWNQWFFIQMYKKGLVYRKKSSVNWCSECNTVLANEQVHNGRCWRHSDVEVAVKQLEQWFIKTTAYAQELLDSVDALDWPHRIKAMQKNWIGRSEGAEIVFSIGGKNWPVFTTRPDTLMGVTFLVVAAGHPDLSELVTDDQQKDVDAFLQKIRSTKQEDLDKLDKEGVFTGSYAVHPLTGENVPVWAGNFVVAEYGSGMVMAVPAHDQRDFDFAKKYAIPLKEVVRPVDGKKASLREAHTGPGTLVNSGDFDGLDFLEAKEHIVAALEDKKLGKKTIQFKLRDWLVSRQRYWGTPIPMVYCDDCGVQPVDEKELPVLLPEDVKFREGNPLASSATFVSATCSKCGNDARRETDTMDTFFDSSWYYLRYLDAQNAKKAFDKKKADRWMPVNFYIGGAEHAVMHLIYARFFSKVLRDLDMVSYDEPFTTLFNQGMVHGEDGSVMSKSRGNVIDPLAVAQEHGADALRLFLVSNASPDKDFAWNQKGIEGSRRLLEKLHRLIVETKDGKSDARTAHYVHSAIKTVSEALDSVSHNKAIIALRSLLDRLPDQISEKDKKLVVQLFAPFAPHICEELWEKLGGKGFVSVSSWPTVDAKSISKEIEASDSAVDRVVGDVVNILRIVQEKGGDAPQKVYVYALPKEKDYYGSEEISRRVGVPVTVYAVNDADKHDPEGKSKKAKPGKPGIYLE